MDCRYITSALKPEQLPDFELPELAFIGRSNTGKSTLINSLLGHSKLARHGRTPGQTQMINFFSVAGQVILADLPGYGFSAIRKDVSDQWQPLVEAYIRRPNIRDFLFLVDCRRELNDEDWELAFLLGRNLPIYLILTKSDKLAKHELQKRVKKLEDDVREKGVAVKKIVCVSSLKKQGLDQVREDLFGSIIPPR